MNISLKTFWTLLIISVALGCQNNDSTQTKTAADILGNPEYLAISYGGYRDNTRDIQPTLEELKEDMIILSAMGIKLIRTYNVHYPHAENVLKAISELKEEDADFEMYVMLGAWIDCENAFHKGGREPNHEAESKRNPIEIAKAVSLAKNYSDIVKIIAVGNEAMVKWAASYYVQPAVILKWVNHLQELKKSGELSKDIWITSSDNFASWGGGGAEYHVDDLTKLIHAVDYISMHTYPMHDTHYNSEFWDVPEVENDLSKTEKIDKAMLRSKNYAISQYKSVVDYMKSVGATKPVHIGETGWASFASELYGAAGSKATDEYKQAIYYKHIREWTNENNISCFYFEAFDEQWKDAKNPQGSENHFGLINLQGEAKYALWNLVDEGRFNGLTRNGKTIYKTYNGNLENLMQDVAAPSSTFESIELIEIEE
jgi:exo-beta-1,3-glucanase (GH17 family)